MTPPSVPVTPCKGGHRHIVLVFTLSCLYYLKCFLISQDSTNLHEVCNLITFWKLIGTVHMWSEREGSQFGEFLKTCWDWLCENGQHSQAAIMHRKSYSWIPTLLSSSSSSKITLIAHEWNDPIPAQYTPFCKINWSFCLHGVDIVPLLRNHFIIFLCLMFELSTSAHCIKAPMSVLIKQINRNSYFKHT